MGSSPFANDRFQVEVTVMRVAQHFGPKSFKVSFDTIRFKSKDTLKLLHICPSKTQKTLKSI